MSSLIHVKSPAIHILDGDGEEPSTPRAMSLDELNALTDKFSETALIGKGSHGRIFYAKLKDGRKAAVKKMDNDSQQNSDSEEFSAQVTYFLRKKMKMSI